MALVEGTAGRVAGGVGVVAGGGGEGGGVQRRVGRRVRRPLPPPAHCLRGGSGPPWPWPGGGAVEPCEAYEGGQKECRKPDWIVWLINNV